MRGAQLPRLICCYNAGLSLVSYDHIISCVTPGLTLSLHLRRPQTAPAQHPPPQAGCMSRLSFPLLALAPAESPLSLSAPTLAQLRGPGSVPPLQCTLCTPCTLCTACTHVVKCQSVMTRPPSSGGVTVLVRRHMLFHVQLSLLSHTKEGAVLFWPRLKKEVCFNFQYQILCLLIMKHVIFNSQG